MSIVQKVAAGLPAVVACLSMVVTPMPALAQVRTGAAPPARTVAAPPVRTGAAREAGPCRNNRFTNGDFNDMVDPSYGPDFAEHEDIERAFGWSPIWQGQNSLADLFLAGTAPPGFNPPPASGNYASMWIANDPNLAINATYREGMFNRLNNPIPVSPADSYSFSFHTAPLYPLPIAAGPPAVIGIYGVNWNPQSPLPQTPLLLNVPPNVDATAGTGLFGAGAAVLLGTVVIPASAANSWQKHVITFDSSMFGPLANITHVMITRADNAEYPLGVTPAKQARYIAFDDFCMQRAVDVTADCPGPNCPDPDFSTCCPPSASFPLGSMFSAVQSNITGPYHLKFTMDPAFDAQMAAYVALAKSLNTSFTGLAMTIRIFNGGTGQAASIATGSQPLEPDAGIHWWAGGGNGNLWSSSFFTSASNLPDTTWIVVEMTTWSLGPGRPWSQNCEVKRFTWRPRYVDLRARRPGRQQPAFIEYKGPPPTVRATPPRR